MKSGERGPETPRFAVVALLLGLWVTTCGPDASEAGRCAMCGMRVGDTPRWNAGITDGEGRARVFDAPRCLFGFVASPAGRGARGAWVRDYYGQRRIDADGAFFVAGSDVLGPMGHDLVPMADRPSAERFRREHHGRAIHAFGEIDSRVLDSLER